MHKLPFKSIRILAFNINIENKKSTINAWIILCISYNFFLKQVSRHINWDKTKRKCENLIWDGGNSWHTSHLSMGGIEVLIKSILSMVPL